MPNATAMKMALLSLPSAATLVVVLSCLQWSVQARLAAERPSIIDRFVTKTREYEKKAEEAEAEAARWSRKAQIAARASGTVNELTIAAIRKRGVADWVAQGSKFHRLLEAAQTPRSPAAESAATAAAAPYVEAAESYKKSAADYAAAATAFETSAKESKVMAHRLEKIADQSRSQGNIEKASFYEKEAKESAKKAEDSEVMHDKYKATAERIEKAVPVIDKMADMAAAHARWEVDPNPALPPQELIHYTVAPPAA